ncbi:TetR/AcrR family transcriptional regulator [Sandaracinobacter sp.]|uniref:TetR/AcrR family transcriptional regulator n=1 Tax=Sandaracinobacter sp. TaxID=2487581 RepID=UPI0035ADF060
MATGARAAETRIQKAESDNRSRRYDPAETRMRVLEAAYLLFGSRGYANTGTADIAAQADVSEGSIFYHFGSKRALLVELGKLHGQKLIAAMQGEDAIEDVTFGQSLTRCFDFREVHNVWEAPGACDQTATNKKINKQNPEAEPFFHAAKETVVGWTQAHLDAMHRKHGIEGIPTDVTANLIFAAVGEAMHQYFGPGVTAEEKARIKAEAIRFCDAATGAPGLTAAAG